MTKAAWVFLLGIIVIPSSAHATLGQSSASIEIDRKTVPHGKASAPAPAPEGNYTVQEITGPIKIREYISLSGVVFAIAWSGNSEPDLKQFLGDYFNDYSAADQNTPRIHGRRSRVVQSDRVTVQFWGHMRDLHGRAFVPGLLPSGMSADDIL